jgi:hypothetical protein
MRLEAAEACSGIGVSGGVGVSGYRGWDQQIEDEHE